MLEIHIWLPMDRSGLFEKLKVYYSIIALISKTAFGGKGCFMVIAS